MKATVLALVVAAALVGGAAWHGVQADSSRTAPVAQTTATPVSVHVPSDGRTSYADIVKAAAPAVVTIRVEGKAKVSPADSQGDDLLRRFFGDRAERGERDMRPRTYKQRGLGSGVIMSGDGYILTNQHVVEGADDIRAELADGRIMSAKLVGSDKPSDLALLKIEGSNLPVLALGDSDAVQVGDVVLAIGNPFGLGQTVTMGIVSAKGRYTTVGDGSYEDFLQTDAPINHGNSGGALVNTKGELIGINSQLAPVSDVNIGIGFAIPANMARHVSDELRTGGRVRRGQLGVTIQPVTQDMAASLGLKDATGAIVSSVEPESAADNAGLKRGDVIQAFNGAPIGDVNALRNRVAGVQPGANATVTIVRDGARRDLTVKLGEASVPKTARRDADGSASQDPAALGVAVSPLTPESASQLGAPKDLHGLVVEEVNPDGRAADAGIQPGDVIQEVNRQPVKSVAELRSAVQGASKPLLLLISREGRHLFVTVKPTA